MKPQLTTDRLEIKCTGRLQIFTDPIDTKIHTLRRCLEDRLIADLTIGCWPTEARIDGEDGFEEVIDQYLRCKAWAERQDVVVCPPFRYTLERSIEIENERELLSTPIFCLMVYHDEELLGVYPHTDGDVTHTVSEAISAIRNGSLPPNLEAIPASPQAPKCPVCRSPTVNGQGIETCSSCPWVATGTYESVISEKPPAVIG